MRKYVVVATILSLASLAGAVPTYNSSWVDLGGGLYGHTFSIDNTGAPASAWFVEMTWSGDPGCVPGTMINQVPTGTTSVNEEAMAILIDMLDPTYDMTLDTWIMDEFKDAIKSITEGPNLYERQSGTVGGLSYVTVDHAYIVSDGSVAYNGRVGVGLTNPIWTAVSGVSCVPEPATLLLLGLGGLGAIIRRKR